VKGTETKKLISGPVG